ncbi:glycosyltransferase family 4 protein [Methylobacterium sp. J-076]|uniref:glycosyltransferase family 4 protein n=1 Tax=Methylobacterium sp. J-076 TaxID=2836655 RepID=UPI001FB92553|nr:glycosyltransferase family 4 protein [Methylobacterium sp. J-076]MCJ2012608.1 glycosyltransferase family 4 protein [Methylobacterium sp. J-076]
MAGRPLKVFVHLAADKDLKVWSEAWRAGTLVGINDETPYGYGRATRMGCAIDFSKTSREWLPTKVLRLGLRVITGFDLLHAWRQRRDLLDADIVWTHTESQYLAVAALVSLSTRRPKILGQSVWLFDRWKSLNALHKVLYRRLIRHVDVLTVHSSENLAVARALFPGKRVLLVPFGIPSERMTAPVERPGQPLRILSVGNDRHRDWPCLVEALDGVPGASATILSGSAPHALMKGRPNLQIMQARSNTELFAQFAEASVVCVPLQPNRHASGITAIQEAVLAGVPVIATATGGLEDYFGPDTVRYVPPNDPVRLREALQEIAADPQGARERAVRAQAHMSEAGIGAESFVRRHVEISRELLGPSL